MSLWDYAVTVYARPGVEAACLDLQDAHGQCAPLLLWRLWALAEGRAVDDAVLAAAVALARDWEGHVTGLLRAVRRSLRTEPDLKAKVAEAELVAERVLLERLEENSPPPRLFAGEGDHAVVEGAVAARHVSGMSALQSVQFCGASSRTAPSTARAAPPPHASGHGGGEHEQNTLVALTTLCAQWGKHAPAGALERLIAAAA